MNKRIRSFIIILCMLLLILPTTAIGKKPQTPSVTILYVDRDDSNSVVARWEFLPEGPGKYILDNDSPVIIEGLPQGYGLLKGNHYVINVSDDGHISPDTVRFKVAYVAVSPTPTAEPAPSPMPTAEPTAKPVPTTEPTPSAAPVPTTEPAPSSEPTAAPTPTTEPAPSSEPAATPAPTVKPVTTPAPTAKPSASPILPPDSDADYDPPKSGDPSVMLTALAVALAAAAFLRRK